MGGAIGDASKTVGSAIDSVPVIGKALNLAAFPLTSGLRLAGAVDNTVQGYQTMRRAPADAMAAANAEKASQAAKAAELQRNLLLQPKQVTPDNFLANKASQLANLRLGMASTISGSAGSGTLSSPTLSASYPGKAKLGQ